MNILGLSCYYHDSAAAIIQDGKVLAASEEERFSREKFDDDFPESSIDFCLKEANLQPEELDCVAFYDKSVLKFERLLDNYLAVAPRGLGSFIDIIPKWIHKRLWIKSEILGKLKGFKGKVVFPDHHLSHAAYSFFTSDFDESAILVTDGVGEWSTTSLGYGKQNKITLTHDIRWPHSLGMFYSAFTYHLGFKVNEGEYKLMGMSAYGKPKFYDTIMKELIDVKNDGSFKLNMNYFAFTYDKVMTNDKFSELFGCFRREENTIEQIHYDLAASAQKVLEDTLLKTVNTLYDQTKTENLCLGGGVALNGLANNRILREGPFKNLFIPPSPGDAGSAIGCALYAYYSFFENNRQLKPNLYDVKGSIYLGIKHSSEDVLNFLNSNKIQFVSFSQSELVKRAAGLIAEGFVVGWFQGKSEWGPRALGNRSILADPRKSDMKDMLNQKIKHRESFRPFAPSVLLERSSEFFDLDNSSPYMLLVVKVKKPQLIPAVTHIDGTARVQTVSQEDNPLYYDLIDEFSKITGIPVLINTSMNVMGEPIVNTPEQAYQMLLKTDMDYLVIGNNLIKKGD